MLIYTGIKWGNIGTCTLYTYVENQSEQMFLVNGTCMAMNW